MKYPTDWTGVTDILITFVSVTTDSDSKYCDATITIVCNVQ